MFWKLAGIGLAGALTGSFLTTLIERLPRGKPFLWGRSRCPRCGGTVAPRDLVPVASFLMLRGRCRDCKAPIPRWHLAVEFAALALFVGSVALGPSRTTADLVLLLVMLALLLALTVVDLQHLLLPDLLVGALAVVGLLRALLFASPSLAGSLFAGAAGFVMLGALAALPWTSRRGALRRGSPRDRSALRSGAPRIGGSAMGLGDVKLAGAMGLTLGLPGLLAALFLAFLGGGAVGGLLLATRRAGWRSRLPFGPFLCGATAAVLVFPNLPAALFRFLGLGYT